MAGFTHFVRLILCAILTLGLTICEFVMCHFTHSISLFVVANQSLYNFLSLTSGVTAIAMAKNNVKSQRNTYGWYRVENVGAFSSLVFLGSLSFGTAIEALQTIFHSGHLDLMHEPVHIFILTLIHIFIWFIVLISIGGYSQYQKRCVRTSKKTNETVAEQRRFLTKFKHLNKIKAGDIFRDLANSVILMVTCALVYLIDEEAYPNAVKFIDPILALSSIIITIWTSIGLSKKLGLTLLQGVPSNLPSAEELKESIRNKFAQYVINIHELHIWNLEPNHILCSLHVTYENFEAYKLSNHLVLDLLRSNGINQITIQPEFPQCCDEQNEEDPGDGLKTLIQPQACILQCKQTNCAAQRCCKVYDYAKMLSEIPEEIL